MQWPFNKIQKQFNFFRENKLFSPENGFKSIRCQPFGNGYFFVLKSVDSARYEWQPDYRRFG
jgi:hypothetical protein